MHAPLQVHVLLGEWEESGASLGRVARSMPAGKQACRSIKTWSRPKEQDWRYLGAGGAGFPAGNPPLLRSL
jgi:hypothetical protein